MQACKSMGVWAPLASTEGAGEWDRDDYSLFSNKNKKIYWTFLYFENKVGFYNANIYPCKFQDAYMMVQN